MEMSNLGTSRVSPLIQQNLAHDATVTYRVVASVKSSQQGWALDVIPLLDCVRNPGPSHPQMPRGG